MEIRAQVYSPLQNTAIWLGAWLYNHVSTDDLIDALLDLGGPHTFRNGELIDLLSAIANSQRPLIDAPFSGPTISLALSGPGDPPALPAGSEAARLANLSTEGALILASADREIHHVLIPTRLDNRTEWDWVEVSGILPATADLSPGHADFLLSQATSEAASIVETTAYAALAPTSLSNPRLKVGSLADFYDTPGLPHAVPRRAATLFSRADRVAAIIETVQQTINDHSLDPQLIPLWRHIRQARMCGVNYALTEFARTR